MKHIDTIQKPCLKDSLVHGGCGECQASCQSACKTSCTVANQSCANKEPQFQPQVRQVSRRERLSRTIRQRIGRQGRIPLPFSLESTIKEDIL